MLCELCLLGPEDEKNEVARVLNCNLLKSKLDIGSDDDSYNDPDYDDNRVEQSYQSSSDDDVYDFTIDDNFNPFEKDTSNDSVFNPFYNTQSRLPSVCSDTPLNSTENFNPFDASSSNQSFHEDKKPNDACNYCNKTFPSSYNCKQHLISVHKIFPPDMTIFECDYKNCQFATGSRVQFSRHNHKLSRVDKISSKPICRICQSEFANSSSLKRHMIRKKHNLV